MNYEAFFSDNIAALKREGRYRVFADLARQAKRFPMAKYRTPQGERMVTVWCSNDYLGMGQHPEVLRAMSDAVQEFGAGAGGTRNIAGTNHMHVLLERELADLHKKEAALLFGSGYLANWTAITTLGRSLRDCVAFSDARNHASLIEGLRQARIEKHVFRHNDPAHLRTQMESCSGSRPKLLVSESVYSMEGSIAPLEEYCALAEEHGALFFLDEVHAVGLYGDEGAGIADQKHLTDRIPLLQGTLGKAFGTMGGYIVGSMNAIDFLRSSGSGFIFTTALPPAIAAAARTAVRVVRREPRLRARLHASVAKVKALLQEAGLPVRPTTGHIVRLHVGDPVACRRICDRLLHRHAIYIQPINYPTVPKGLEMLRITPTPLHSDSQIAYLQEALAEVWTQSGCASCEDGARAGSS